MGLENGMAGIGYVDWERREMAWVGLGKRWLGDNPNLKKWEYWEMAWVGLEITPTLLDEKEMAGRWEKPQPN